MSDVRPTLRIVRDGEERQQAAPPSSAVAASKSPLRGPERLEFESLVGQLELRRAEAASRALLAGKTLVAGALDIRHRAVSHAPTSFHRGVTPGEKATEAAHALLEALGTDLASGICDADTVRFAAVDAAEELDRAAEVADRAGLDVDGDRKKLFRHATQFLRATPQRLPEARPAATGAAPRPPAPQMALLALGAEDAVRRQEQPISPVAAGVIGGIIGGAVVALLFA